MYSEPPWVFKGRALYQLQLVKSEEAKKRIPEGFKLVEAFGYTLGGFYLARYDDSPAGSFDELVALTGLVWNPPTSCAWAARVYVNSKDARDHGLQSVGLPSRLADFREVPASEDDKKIRFKERRRRHGLGLANWWRQGKGCAPSLDQTADADGSYLQGFPDVQVWNMERARGRGLKGKPVCTFTSLPHALPAGGGGLGPRIRMFLPSFSGGTMEHPGLLKYSCDLRTNVRLLPPARVLLPLCEVSGASGSESTGGVGGREHRGGRVQQQASSARYAPEEGGELMHAVLGGKPLLTMAFDNMEMHVEAPLRLELPDADLKPALSSCAGSGKNGR